MSRFLTGGFVLNVALIYFAHAFLHASKHDFQLSCVTRQRALFAFVNFKLDKCVSGVKFLAIKPQIYITTVNPFFKDSLTN